MLLVLLLETETRILSRTTRSVSYAPPPAHSYSSGPSPDGTQPHKASSKSQGARAEGGKGGARSKGREEERAGGRSGQQELTSFS
eukprot:177013-Hanusia_phi.AAC.1